MTKKEFETTKWGVGTKVYLKTDKTKTPLKLSAVDFEQYLIEFIVDTGYKNVMFDEVEIIN